MLYITCDSHKLTPHEYGHFMCVKSTLCVRVCVLLTHADCFQVVKQVAWHFKGDYFVVTCSDGEATDKP